MFDQGNPDHLRERAEMYNRIAQRMTDAQTSEAFRNMARECRSRAEDMAAHARIAEEQAARGGESF